MPTFSSPLPPKTRQLKVTAATPTTVLITLVFLALFVRSCEPRHLLPHGKDSSSRSPPPAPCKADGSPINQKKNLSNAVDATGTLVDQVDAKVKKGVPMAMASSGAGVQTTIASRVSRRLSQRELQGEGTEFHLDYAGPITHPPSHN
ncbi:hypothetical protein BRADI_5g17935v3 [Brachypodium distachyon]|uniref:Uncharacterized protein n=1 Tax=Brachypodium distachyon TaxID=15368 RepID=A0A0Q3EC59_BRADI|nr:hypothetical protein BRADI_5g17935v3 [Brachypodium distachyon]